MPRGFSIDLAALTGVAVALVATGISAEELGARAVLALVLVAVLLVVWACIRGARALLGPPSASIPGEGQHRAQRMLAQLRRDGDVASRIAIVGAVPGAGASTVAAAIASVLTEAADREVALIDVSALSSSEHNAVAARTLRDAESAGDRFVIDAGAPSDPQEVAALMYADRLVVVAAGEGGLQQAYALLARLADKGLAELAGRAVVVQNHAPARSTRSAEQPDHAAHPVVSVAADVRLRRRSRVDRIDGETRQDLVQLATVLGEAGPRPTPSPGPRPGLHRARRGLRRSTAG